MTDPLKVITKLLVVTFLALCALCTLTVINIAELRHFRKLYELHVEPYIRMESTPVHLDPTLGLVPDQPAKEAGLSPKITPRHLGNSKSTE